MIATSAPMTLSKYLALAAVLIAALSANLSLAELPPPKKIGLIASLSGFASSWGTAVKEGAELAAVELNETGAAIVLIIEDDQSNATDTVSAYQKLRSLSNVDTIVGGSWWLNSIVKKADSERVLLLSCETLWNKDAVAAPHYFLLSGDLRTWMRAYEPLIQAKSWRRGLIVRYASGFGQTLSEEMERIFSTSGRTWLGEVEYADITLSDASSVALEVRKRRADVVYIDAQPGGYAVLVRKLKDIGVRDTALIAHTVAFDALEQKLVDPALIEGAYYSQRETAAPAFAAKFRARYQRDPILNADLGYYAVLLAVRVQNEADRVKALERGMTIDGLDFRFDENHSYLGRRSMIYQVKNGQGELVTPAIAP
ncbi:MAG: ABC transporter substrate-binding protein [Deltaproteobacteria bacterium]|nr:ABC transporter substrate-binding protein [Deltaproteobacteria bacterium]